ncbi:zinc ribbon domain-containing protein [Ramlibacter sp. H39-3-26]|uniref:zinc ribbon domain-containing protein n=1 Tax=Curvibacter soli TaxID=3031331 RepID=UPI0023DCD5C6|nr:zinc ribbon domain-containing protein [Ramlibacter sp. H39-3-26]MDF1485004.1 zinc ribbon domain-containing protein [Ramlibacter sp. H39-3-26]
MNKGLRLSEQWFRRGLWLVAFAFAWFLSGLGSTIVGDLPRVEQRQTLDDFMAPQAAAQARAAIAGARRAEQNAQAALEQARLKARAAQAEQRSARETFDNWLAARRATGSVGENAELQARLQALDGLQAAARQAQARAEAQEQAALDARQAAARAQDMLAQLEQGAQEQLEQARRRQELRVFGYRLALTLPLLAVAGWLFAKKRKSTYWPFVWGFIFFALFAFFVELVPYLPSYGGYVRYAVGIVVTALVGRYAIVALNRYLERQKEAEALPDAERRKDLDYDVALARLAKGVCPGCERAVDLKDGKTDFCPHCGIGLFARSGACGTRRSAFARYCQACGAAATPAP